MEKPKSNGAESAGGGYSASHTMSQDVRDTTPMAPRWHIISTVSLACEAG